MAPSSTRMPSPARRRSSVSMGEGVNGFMAGILATIAADHLPQPKSAVADFGHHFEWPNPRYSEVRLGGGRTAFAVRVGVAALPHTRPRRHPTPDRLRRQKDVLCPPPAGEGEEGRTASRWRCPALSLRS